MASIPLVTLQPKPQTTDKNRVDKERFSSDDVERSSVRSHDGNQDPLLEDELEERAREDYTSGRRAWSTKRAWQKPAMCYLVPVYLLYTLGYGGIWIPKLDLIYDLTCRTYCIDHTCEPDLRDSEGQCRAPEVQGLAAEFVMVCNLLGGIISIFTCPKFGQWSELHGRTRILAIGGSGMLINCMLTILVATFPDTFPLPWIYMTYILESVLGPYASIMAIANSYAADITTP